MLPWNNLAPLHRQIIGAIVGGILGLCVAYTLLAILFMFASGKVG